MQHYIEIAGNGELVAVGHGRPNDRGNWTIEFPRLDAGMHYTCGIPGHEGSQLIVSFPSSNSSGSADFHISWSNLGGWYAIFLRGAGSCPEVFPAYPDEDEGWLVELPARIVDCEVNHG